MKIFQFFYNELSEAFNKRHEIQEKGQRDVEPNLHAINQAVNELFIIEKLRIYCASLNLATFSSKKRNSISKNELLFVPEILNLLNNNPSSWHPIIQIYLCLINWLEKILLQPEEVAKSVAENLRILKIQIEQQTTFLTIEEQIELYSFITNLMTTLINSGHKEFLSTYISMNERILELQQESEEAFIMDSGVYKNLVVAMLRNHEDEQRFEKALQFLEAYQSYLQPQDKKYYQYCKALVDFEQGRIQTAFDIISGLKRTKDMFLNFNIKVLQLQIYYEIEDINFQKLIDANIIIEKVIESFRAMLKHEKFKRPRMSEEHFSFYDDFLVCYKILNKWYLEGGARNPSDEQDARKLKLLQKLSTKNYSYEEWFKRQLKN